MLTVNDNFCIISEKRKTVRAIKCSIIFCFDFRLLGQFRTAVNEFMRSCIDVVHSTLDNPRPKPDSDSLTDPKLPEIFYETLFMSFSKIFFLNPR